MNPVKQLLQTLLIMFTALQLAACARTVLWEEEVLLNTGETIWVSKEVRYTIKGQPGNPMDRGYLPDQVETVSFKYGGRDFTYRGKARVMVLAISPQKMPVLIARPTANDWYVENDYKCVTPYYVQLTPDSTGQRWTWPDRIEPWSYDLPTNLLLHRDDLFDVKRRYTIADKSKQTELQDPRLSYIQKVDPLYSSDNCKGSN